MGSRVNWWLANAFRETGNSLEKLSGGNQLTMASRNCDAEWVEDLATASEIF